MKRIIIIGEGATEQAFCNSLLQPHFNAKGIYIQSPVISKSGGGIVSWEALKRQIENYMKSDPSVFVTLFIDYYGIEEKHNYPDWLAGLANPDKYERIRMMEEGMRNDLHASFRHRFIPYVQLHEFEGLLFCGLDVFDTNFKAEEFLDHDYLVETIAENDNPELINDGTATAPSKRLARILKDYYVEKRINNKVLYGSLISEEIGLNQMREKCPHFNEWITQLENV